MRRRGARTRATAGLWLALALCAHAAPWRVALADADAALGPGERALRAGIEARAAELWDTLGRWVTLNTGSHNLDGLDAFADQLGERLAGVGFEVEKLPGPGIEYPDGVQATGPLLRARRPGPAGAPRLLLSGHMDTVFEPASPFQMLGPVVEGRASGPGAADMKGGLVVMLAALEALDRAGELGGADWTVLLDSDEELGSLASRPLIEEAARAADYGFVFESARPGGAMVRSRRGLGQLILTVEGVAAHAGSDHRRGRSAVAELARQIVAIEALTDYERGVTLNAGVIRGGTKRNVVPERAQAWIDLRYDRPELGAEVIERIEALAAAPRVPGTRTRVWARLHRPPKAATAATLELLERHAAVARALGAPAGPPVHAGGGTDGSLMAAVGLPTLDSMGVRGGRAHTDREFLVAGSLVERAALAAILWRRLILDSAPGGR